MDEQFERVDGRGIVYGRRGSLKQAAARRMRREMTAAEALLWERLRANRLEGLHFRRQQVIDGLIADFYCHAAGLVVECDGPIHERQREHDEDRDAILKARDLRVLRFTNDEIESNTDQVLATIAATAQARITLLETATPTRTQKPPPLRGGGGEPKRAGGRET